MKAILALFLLCIVYAVVPSGVSGVPTPGDDEVDQPRAPFYNPYSYQYMMCRMQCRQSCLEQGYYKGVCKQGACYCFGPMGPYGRINGFPIPSY